MFSVIRRHVRLSPATVIAGLALVFAMTGGAYAAKKYLITSTKQISPKVLKQLQGKAGPAGVPGVGGAQGPAGAAGPAGPAGPAGSGGGKGETGPAGAKGEKGATGAAGAKGATGATGTTGFTETLPAGKTETGTWSVAVPPTTEYFEFQVPISFPIPLAKASAEGAAYFFTAKQVEEGEFGSSGCHWETFVQNAKPEATTPGTLCVFAQFENLENVTGPFFQKPGEPFESGYGPSGAYMLLQKQLTTGAIASTAAGVWAVTAPSS